MNRTKKIIISSLIFLITAFVLIGISYNATTKKFNIPSLAYRENKNGVTVFCLQKGALLNAELTPSHTIQIGGEGKGVDYAYNTTTKKSNKNARNAKLAYICYRASTEGVNTYNHGSSNTQCAIWYCWNTWMSYCGEGIGVPQRFAINSKNNLTEAQVKKAKDILASAQEYYETVYEGANIKVKKSEARVIDNSDYDYIYVGPFKVIESTRFIDLQRVDRKENETGCIGIATREGGERETGVDYHNNFYLMFDRNNKKNKVNYQFNFIYKINKINANLKLYYYNGAGSTHQNVAEVTTELIPVEQTIEFGLTTQNQKEELSLQKYIVETGSEFSNGKINGTYFNDRANKYADSSLVDGEEGIYKYTNSTQPQIADSIEKSYAKTNNPVKINAGDYVVYKITVYNDCPSAVSYHIRDRIDALGELIRCIYYI